MRVSAVMMLNLIVIWPSDAGERQLPSPAAAADAWSGAAAPVRFLPGVGPAARPAVAAAPHLDFEWASVFEAGQPVAPGDYTRTVRPFLDWTQVCDALRGGRRICYLETVARAEGAQAGWRIALTKDGRAMALLILPRDADAAAGATVIFGSLSRVAKPLVCDRAVCVATFPVDGPLLALLAREDRARIDFGRGGQAASIPASLRGLGLALADLTPRGKEVVDGRPRGSAGVTRPATSAGADNGPARSGEPWRGMR
ncbi:MAG: invasion associated locus B family protein [Kiritimatiellia bacterium]